MSQTSSSTNSPDHPTPKEAWPRWFSLGVVLSAITVMTAVMTLLGYGQDLGRLDAVGLSPERLQRTPLDFLLRSKDVVLTLLTFLSKLTWQHLLAMLSNWWAALGMSMVALCFLAFIVTYVLTQEGRRRIHQVESALKASWIGRVTAKLVRSLKLRQIWRIATARSRLLCYGAPLGVAAVFFAAPVLVAGILWVMGALFFACVAFIPALPVQAAFDAARAEIVDPTTCRRPNDVLTHRTEQGARCVRVYRNGCEVARGRYIDESSHRIWLLKKKPWNVLSVPLDGNTVGDVDTEEPSASIKICDEMKP